MAFQTVLFFILDNSNQQSWDKFIPLITFVAGYLFNFILNKLKENKELERYEHSLIIDILDIQRDTHPSTKMKLLYDQQKKEPSFFKIKNYDIVRLAISEGLVDNKVNEKELGEIRKNFDEKFKKRWF